MYRVDAKETDAAAAAGPVELYGVYNLYDHHHLLQNTQTAAASLGNPFKQKDRKVCDYQNFPDVESAGQFPKETARKKEN